MPCGSLLLKWLLMSPTSQYSLLILSIECGLDLMTCFHCIEYSRNDGIVISEITMSRPMTSVLLALSCWLFSFAHSKKKLSFHELLSLETHMWRNWRREISGQVPVRNWVNPMINRILQTTTLMKLKQVLVQLCLEVTAILKNTLR